MTPRLIQAAVLLFPRRVRRFALGKRGPIRRRSALRRARSRDLRWAVGAGLPSGLGRSDDEHGAGDRKAREAVAGRCRQRHKQPVAGVPRVVVSSQGGLLDVVASPDFAGDQLVYLTYSEPSRNGGSGLALARAKLVRGSGGWRLDGLHVIWRDPQGGEGGQFGAIVAFAPGPQVAVPELRASGSASPRRRIGASRSARSCTSPSTASRRPAIPGPGRSARRPSPSPTRRATPRRRQAHQAGG